MRQKPVFAFAALCFGLYFLVCANRAGAQMTTGTLGGTVVDPSGAVVPGVTVTANRIETNQNFVTKTNGSGEYAVPSLPEGQYTITAKAQGFATQAKSGIVLGVGQTLRIDFKLAVGATTQTTQVSAQAPLINTTNPSYGQVLSPKMVQALPLNQRDIVALTTLTPGIVPPRGQIQGGNLDSGGFIVRGMRRSDNIIYLNGAFIIDGNGAPTFLPNIDAIQEFQVLSGLYGAQYGVMDGGQLVVVTKSGGNHFHGDAFEFLRDDILDGTDYFAQKKTPFTRNDFGGTLGGPVWIPKLYNGRNRLWFFLSLEKVITHQFSPASTVVPTDAEKNGVFPTPVIDPTTGQDFPNNTIPKNRISSISQQFLQFYPEPNATGNINYVSPNTSVNNSTGQLMLKVDFDQSQNNRWWGQYVRDSTPLLVPSPFLRFNNQQPLGTMIASFGNVYTLHGKYVNDISLNAFRRPYTETNSPLATCNFAQGLGIPQFPESTTDMCGVPLLSIQGYGGIGDSAVVGPVLAGAWWLPEQFSFQQGSHFIQAGVDWLRQVSLFALGLRSSFAFTPRYTGNSFGDFLLGLPTSTALGGEALRANIRRNSVHYWVQDSWRVHPRLTLNLGLRYEYRLSPKDKRGYSANFDPATGTLYPALQNITLQPGQTGRFIANYPLYKEKNIEGFLPRIGFALRATKNIVVRGGYSLYAAQPVIGEVQNMGSNPRPGAASLSFQNGFSTPVFTFANPFPENLAHQGVPSAGGIQNPIKLERSHEWGLSVENSLSRNLVLDIGYDGSHTQNVIEMVSLNDAPPGPGVLQQKRPYPAYSSISFAQADGTADYNGMQVKVEKRPGNEGLDLLGGLTWSKAIDNTESRLVIQGENNSRSRNMPLSKERALSSSNIGLRLVMSADYQLPFGVGRAFLNNSGVGPKVFGGWSLQTIATVQSGPWMTIFLPGDPINTGSSVSQRPDILCNPNLDHSKRTIGRWFNTGCFAKPTGYVYGDAPRSTVQAPGIVNADIAIHRTFHWRDGQTLEFRGEAFNSMNHPNFGLPGDAFGTPSFATIHSAQDPREIQLGVKYLF